jgi:hypothetical protein
MWLLVIATTFFAHSGNDDPTIYQFQEFTTKQRCVDFKNWIVNRNPGPIASKRMTVECVLK